MLCSHNITNILFISYVEKIILKLILINLSIKTYEEPIHKIVKLNHLNKRKN